MLTHKDLAVVTLIAMVMSQSLLYGNFLLLFGSFWAYDLWVKKRLNED